MDLFESDFRVVADYLVKRRKHGNEYVPSAQELSHVEAVVELLGAMTGDSRYKDALEEAWARGREVTTLDTLFSSVLEKGEANGRAEGRAERERELVLGMFEDGMPAARIAKVSGLTEEEVIGIARAGEPSWSLRNPPK